MKEIKKALQWCKQNGSPCVIATLIHVDGSAYQHEGSRCVIHENGSINGMLSGGCVEEDIKERAHTVFDKGEPQTVHLSFRGEEELLWGLGSGCGGDLTVWLELYDTERDPNHAISLLDELEHREGCQTPYYSVTILESENPDQYQVGQRLRFNADSRDFHLYDRLPGRLKCERHQTKLTLFVEKIQPLPRLSIIGTGEDASLLCQMAKSLGWYVNVVFHPTVRAHAAYFPEVDAIVHVPRGDFSNLTIYSDHYVIVMSHQLEIDLEAVRQLLPTSVCYVGLLGSKSRVNRIIDRIGGESPSLDKKLFGKLFSPVGLDIGAETPEEITLSIMAELLAYRNRANGGFLRDGE